MNWVDLLILGILAYCGLTGFFKGFFRAIFGLLGLIAATLASGWLGGVGAVLVGQSANDPFGAVIGGAVIGLLVYAGVSIVGFLLARRLRSTWMGKGDRWAGLALGLSVGVLTVLVPLAFLDTAPIVKQQLPVVARVRSASLLWRALVPLEAPVLALTRLVFGWSWDKMTTPKMPDLDDLGGTATPAPARKKSPPPARKAPSPKASR